MRLNKTAQGTTRHHDTRVASEELSGYTAKYDILYSLLGSNIDKHAAGRLDSADTLRVITPLSLPRFVITILIHLFRRHTIYQWKS